MDPSPDKVALTVGERHVVADLELQASRGHPKRRLPPQLGPFVGVRFCVGQGQDVATLAVYCAARVGSAPPGRATLRHHRVEGNITAVTQACGRAARSSYQQTEQSRLVTPTGTAGRRIVPGCHDR